jgi:hypothetical protein
VGNLAGHLLAASAEDAAEADADIDGQTSEQAHDGEDQATTFAASDLAGRSGILTRVLPVVGRVDPTGTLIWIGAPWCVSNLSTWSGLPITAATRIGTSAAVAATNAFCRAHRRTGVDISMPRESTGDAGVLVIGGGVLGIRASSIAFSTGEGSRSDRSTTRAIPSSSMSSTSLSTSHEKTPAGPQIATPIPPNIAAPAIVLALGRGRFDFGGAVTGMNGFGPYWGD